MSMKTKAITIIVSILTLFLLVFSVILYAGIYSVLISELNTGASGVATAIASNIEHRIDEYKEYIKIVNKINIENDSEEVIAEKQQAAINTPYYQEMLAMFNNIKASGDVTFVYVIDKYDNRHMRYTIDSETKIDGKDASEYETPPGSIEEITPIEYEAFSGNTIVKSNEFEYYPEYGYLSTVDAPIHDLNGNVVAFVGVDTNYTVIVNRMKFFVILIILIITIITGSAVMLLIKFFDNLVKPLMVDKLTSAYNKRYMNMYFKERVMPGLRKHELFSMFMIDVDKFKHVNDTYGHITGDIVLTEVSAAIRSVLRDSDTFIRFGGDEFMVVFERIKAADVRAIAERMRVLVEGMSIPVPGTEETAKVTLSVGIALSADNALTTSEFISMADIALYQAKVTRNNVVQYAEGMRKAE